MGGDQTGDLMSFQEHFNQTRVLRFQVTIFLIYLIHPVKETDITTLVNVENHRGRFSGPALA
jgi:hypothetical protein